MSIPWKRVVQAAGVCAIANAAIAIPVLDDGNVHTVMINYVPGEFAVYIDDMQTPHLTIPIDLRDVGEPGLGLLGPDGRAWVGFTAGRENARAHQDILSWRLEPARLVLADRGLSPVGFSIHDFSNSSMIEMQGQALQAGDRLRIMPANSPVPRHSGNVGVTGTFGINPHTTLERPTIDRGCYAPNGCIARASAWHATPQYLAQGFTTIFEFQVTKVAGDLADGFTFVIQNQSIDALGGDGGFGLGYWDGQTFGNRIAPAIAIEFDTFANGLDPVGPGHPCACTHDPANHISVNTTVAPATFYSVDALGDQLVLISADTGVVTPIGPVGFDAHKVDLVVSGGRIYAVNSDPAGPEMLYVLDHGTGNGSPVGQVNVVGSPVELFKGLGVNTDGSLVAGFGDTDRAYRLGAMGFDGTIMFHADLRTTGALDPDIDALAVSRQGRLLAANADLGHPGETLSLVDVGTLPAQYDVAHTLPVTPQLRSVDDMMFANGSLYGVDWELSRLHRFDLDTGDVIASVPIEPRYRLGALTLAPATICPADIDYDNDVDITDFGALIDAFGTEGHIPFTGGDLNGDGTVNVLDFARLAAGFGCGR